MTDGPRFHSMASFHGGCAVCLSALPALLFTLLFLQFEGPIVDAITVPSVPESDVAGISAGQLSLIEAEIKSIARGNVFGDPEQWRCDAPESYLRAGDGDLARRRC